MWRPRLLDDSGTGRVPHQLSVALTVLTPLFRSVAFLYSGLARRKSALALIWSIAAANAVTIFQWYFWGTLKPHSPEIRVEPVCLRVLARFLA